MSFYATISGTLTYETDEAFDNAVKMLVNGEWIDEEGFFMDETGAMISGDEGDDIDKENRTIGIPFSFYRGLSGLLCTKCFDDKPGLLAGSKGKIVWTSTDGCFSGGVIIDGVEKTYDLEKWNEENGGENPPDIEQDFDAYCAWQTDIEVDFFNVLED